jgi:hypothetical protein
MDENLREVPKSLRFLHIQHKSANDLESCDDETQPNNFNQLLPHFKILSNISNNDNSIYRSNSSNLRTTDERSVRTFDIRYTNPNEIFGKLGERKRSKSLPELKDLAYLRTLSFENNKESESLTDSESLLSQDITPNWKSKVDFLFTGMTLSLGLNNIWR